MASTPCSVGYQECVITAHHCRNTLSHQRAIKCTRFASTLCVSERGDPRVQPEAFGQNIFDVIGTNRLEISVVSAFGDDNDCFALPDLTVLKEGKTWDGGRWTGDLHVGSSRTCGLPTDFLWVGVRE